MLLKVDRLTAGYGDAQITREVSFTLDSGESLAILGRNGVGKTTLLRAIFGLADRHDGHVFVDDAPVRVQRPEALAARRLTMVPDTRGIFPSLTVAENLRLAKRRDGGKPQLDPLTWFPELQTRLHQPARELSGGLQQQLAIGRAFATQARLIAIDELSQGLQPSVVSSLVEGLRFVSQELGTTLLLVDQNQALALRLCTRAVILHKGRVVADVPAEVITENPEQYVNWLTVS